MNQISETILHWNELQLWIVFGEDGALGSESSLKINEFNILGNGMQPLWVNMQTMVRACIQFGYKDTFRWDCLVVASRKYEQMTGQTIINCIATVQITVPRFKGLQRA